MTERELDSHCALFARLSKAVEQGVELPVATAAVWGMLSWVLSCRDQGEHAFEALLEPLGALFEATCPPDLRDRLLRLELPDLPAGYKWGKPQVPDALPENVGRRRVDMAEVGAWLTAMYQRFTAPVRAGLRGPADYSEAQQGLVQVLAGLDKMAKHPGLAAVAGTLAWTLKTLWEQDLPDATREELVP